MGLDNSLTRLRRFLRDPDGDIFSDDDIRTWWNDSQMEFAQKTNILERVEAHYYPPVYTWSYMHDWEYEHTDGDRFRCLTQNQANGNVITYPWEATYWMDNSETPDDGYRFTHPWESGYAAPADVVPIQLHAKFNRMKFAAFDLYPIFPLLEREIAIADPFYRTVSGFVTNYYPLDGMQNQIVLYPRPSSITWQETEDTDIFDDLGGLLYDEADLDQRNTGIATDIIDADGALFTVYTAIPNEIDNWADSLYDFPDWLLKYIEYGTLERAYGADSDAFIPSLRDYWKLRKEIGLKAVQRFMRMKSEDRDYRLGGARREIHGRGGRLPAGYPAI